MNEGDATIGTERLRLRRHGLADIEARIAMTADPAVMAHVGGVQGAQENAYRVLRYAGQWQLLGRGPWAIEEKASGRVIGEAGIGEMFRGLGAGFDASPEAYWMLAAGAHGQGYAGEAMAAILAWHEARFGRQRLVAIIAPGNAPSLKLADRLGFRTYAEISFRERPTLLLERP